MVDESKVAVSTLSGESTPSGGERETGIAEPPPAAADAPAGANGESASTTPDAPGAEAGDSSATAEPQPTTAAAAADAPAGAADGASADTESAASPATRAPKRRGVGQAKLASLYRAMRSGRPINGTIRGVIKGGYEVALGKVRGFCPHSQIDLHRVDEPERHVGQTYAFRVIQVRRGGADVVVSRRSLLEEQRVEEAKAVRATLLEGAVMRGRVAGIAEFGAFVDLGAGVMGLVHVSELAHSRVTRVADVVQVGDPVQVKILRLAEGGKKISLSMRQAERDPWADVAQRFRPGDVVAGSVLRLADFGAFVGLAPGIEALAPASEFPPSPGGWRDGLEAGHTGDWLVLAVDARQRRLTVTRPAEAIDGNPERLEVGSVARGRVQRVESYGVFVWLGPGRVGLMPNALSGAPRGADMSKRFPVAQEIEVEVLEIDEDGRRIRLARKGSAPREARGTGRSTRPRSERRGGARREPPPPQPSGNFGTSLGDKLRTALARQSKSD